ncbi:hypothetical protein TNIN_209121 [Trichonephila inaurata madagascariensis]|uniref:C2H2-type domain-containing protein n=1 Tax=Trichonephila inaurata madagascariensis TaxID=2747483 RepID=A0A8X7CCP9_9ARAC|nr:hypothetical protein TNIN_209121 [Trichonephila inaurata madagascariensis]
MQAKKQKRFSLLIFFQDRALYAHGVEGNLITDSKQRKLPQVKKASHIFVTLAKRKKKEMAGNIAFVVSPGSCYTCTQCGVAFEAGYQREQIISSDNTSHRCKVCGKTFRRSDHLLHHSYQHSHQWPYRCSFCQKGFAQHLHFERHKRQRNIVRNIRCKKCSNYFQGKICFIMRLDAYCEKCSDGSSPVEYVAS